MSASPSAIEPAEQATHRVRPHAFTSEHTYALGPDAITATLKGTPSVIPYSDITSVNLIDYANAGELHHQCTVTTRKHGKHKIRSHHFVSLGGFEGRTETYAAFVRELCRRLQAANPSAEFRQGSGWIQGLWLVVLGLCVFGWIMWGATVMEGGTDMQTAGGFFVGLLALTFLSWRWFRRSKPDPFDPQDPPVP